MVRSMESRRNVVVQDHGVTYVRANPAVPFTNGEKARRFAMAVTATLAIAGVCLVLAGYGGKEASRSALAVQRAKIAPVVSHRMTRLDEEAPPAEEAAADSQSSGVPDPEEAKKKAQEALNKASGFATAAIASAEEAVQDVLPEGFDVLHALVCLSSWHADLCVYLACLYTVYYIWLCQVWRKIFPELHFNMDLLRMKQEKTEKLNNQSAPIGTWGNPGDTHQPNDQSLLWFRVAAKEEMLFAESQKVLPGLMDMIMCGCGGNAYAVAVTNKRIIIQNDKRCLFGSTTLTTNEESFFLKNVHKANLNTDGALNLGICTLHSAEMLTGGFNWIFFGFIIDLVLEWKPTLMDAIDDDRLKGWINMVPDDVIFMVASAFVILGAFLFCALLFFLMCPQSVLEVEFVKQAGTSSYSLKFAYPVGLAYAMHDAIMQGRFGAGPFNVKID